MLWHAISPSRAYVKAPHDVVRHSKLSSDAKILIVYVQGLPESRAGEALSDHAKKLGIKGRAYQKAKGQLRDAGFVHEWRRQVGGRAMGDGSAVLQRAAHRRGGAAAAGHESPGRTG